MKPFALNPTRYNQRIIIAKHNTIKHFLYEAECNKRKLLIVNAHSRPLTVIILEVINLQTLQSDCLNTDNISVKNTVNDLKRSTLLKLTEPLLCSSLYVLCGNAISDISMLKFRNLTGQYFTCDQI